MMQMDDSREHVIGGCAWERRYFQFWCMYASKVVSIRICVFIILCMHHYNCCFYHMLIIPFCAAISTYHI